MTASWRKQHSCLTRFSIPCMKLLVGHKYSWQFLQWGKAELLNHCLKPTFIDSPISKVLISLYHWPICQNNCECSFERFYTNKIIIIIQSFQVVRIWRLAIINYRRKNETASGYLWSLSAFNRFLSQIIISLCLFIVCNDFYSANYEHCSALSVRREGSKARGARVRG